MKSGDLVRYVKESKELNVLGFEVGELYFLIMVGTELAIEHRDGSVVLFDQYLNNFGKLSDTYHGQVGAEETLVVKSSGSYGL